MSDQLTRPNLLLAHSFGVCFAACRIGVLTGGGSYRWSFMLLGLENNQASLASCNDPLGLSTPYDANAGRALGAV